MRAFARHRTLVDLQCIAFDYMQLLAERLLKLCERGKTTPISFDGDNRCSGIEQCARQATGSRSDLVNPLSIQWAWNGSDTREELAIENEILPQRLARAEAVTGDDVA